MHVSDDAHRMNSLETQEVELPVSPKLPPGAIVRVSKGIFGGRIGTVLDSESPVGSRGIPLAKPRPGYYWVKVALYEFAFAAHLHEDEIELLSEKMP
jgi:hypothetical protein